MTINLSATQVDSLRWLLGTVDIDDVEDQNDRGNLHAIARILDES